MFQQIAPIYQNKNMRKIIFIEGTPGVGKTTYINQLISQKKASFQWVSSDDVIPENTVRKAIREGKSLTIDEARSIYREKSYFDYCCEHLKIWENFCINNQAGQDDIIIDAGLIQAPLYELIGLYLLSSEQILSHLQKIVDMVKNYFMPELIYIKTPYPDQCIRKAIENQQERRVQWVKGLCVWLEVAPYPMKKGYSRLQGIEQFVIDRASVDIYLIDNLVIDKKIYSRDCV